MSYKNNPYEFTVKKTKNRYHYQVKNIETDETVFEDIIPKTPRDIGQRTDIGKVFLKLIKENTSEENLHKEFFNCKKTLEDDLVEDFSEVEKQIKKAEKKKSEDNNQYYNKLLEYCKDEGFTLLDYLAELTKGLGVGADIEIMRSYFAFFQTVCGVHGLNVIMIGETGQGKTWTIIGALKMIPPENVVQSVLSESAFLRKYAGKDVTGLIFNLGDLGGGSTDDEKTIAFRNILKTLITDSYYSKETLPDGELTNDVVTGTPSITYTTADESIMNSQEESRSFVGYAPIADTRQMAAFQELNDGKGRSKQTLEKIEKSCEKFRSVIYHFKEVLELFTVINPYVFNIEDFLHEDPNYNRLNKEFKALLKIVTLLNQPRIFDLKTHEETINDKDKIKTPHLLIPSKQDNINALILLNNNKGLLTPEVDLANGLLREYDHMDDFETIDEDITLYIEELRGVAISDDGEHDSSYCFTVSDLKNHFPTKQWIIKNKTYLPQKLYRLMDSGLIIKIGKLKSSNENIYCLSPNFKSPINLGIPVFQQKDFKLGLDLFKYEYPEIYENAKEIIEEDFLSEIDDVSFNTGKSGLFDLLWEDEKYIRGDS